MTFLHTLPGSIAAMAALYVIFLPIPWAIKLSGILDEAEAPEAEEDAPQCIVPGTNRHV